MKVTWSLLWAIPIHPINVILGSLFKMGTINGLDFLQILPTFKLRMCCVWVINQCNRNSRVRPRFEFWENLGLFSGLSQPSVTTLIFYAIGCWKRKYLNIFISLVFKNIQYSTIMYNWEHVYHASSWWSKCKMNCKKTLPYYHLNLSTIRSHIAFNQGFK